MGTTSFFIPNTNIIYSTNNNTNILTTTLSRSCFSINNNNNNKTPRSSSSLLSSKPKIKIIIIRRRRRRWSRSIINMSTRLSPPLQFNAASASSSASSSTLSENEALVGANDLLIIGPGVLGRLVAQQWRQDHPACQIYGQTVTTDHHDELIRMGISPSLKGLIPAQKFPYVIFCAPPYQTADYPGDIREAALSWNGEGSFLFTSSSAPYDCYDNGQCYEDSPVVPIGKSPRTDVLLKAEKVVLESGGCVLRLAGLYKEGKGAHVYWLEKGNVDARPDHILNLIHYEDAASLSIAILEKKLQGRVFLGCDNHPLSRQEIMDIVSDSGKFSKKFGSFTGTNDPLGKKLNNEKTRKEIGWEPKYPSFAYFLGGKLDKAVDLVASIIDTEKAKIRQSTDSV